MMLSGKTEAVQTSSVLSQMYKNSITYSVAAIVVFISVVIVVSYHGNRSRKFASGAFNHSVSMPEEAYLIWKEKEVKGRTLLLFGKYPHVKRRSDYAGIAQLSQSNFIELSVFENIVRRIYFIVPENDWEEFILTDMIKPIRRVGSIERGLQLYNLLGIPIIATTQSSLPRLSETVLVYIDSRIFDSAQIHEFLKQKNISGDIIVSYQESSR